MASESKHCSGPGYTETKQLQYPCEISRISRQNHVQKEIPILEFQVSVCPISRVSLLPKDSPKKTSFCTPTHLKNPTTQPNPSTSTHPVFRCQRLLSWKEGHVHRWKFTLLLLHTFSTPTMLPLERHRHVGFCDAHVGTVHHGTPSTTSPPKKKRTKIDVENRGDAKKMKVW